MNVRKKLGVWRIGYAKSTASMLMLLCLWGCDSKREQVYVAPEAGLIKNQAFTMGDSGRLTSWGMLQHAGAVSYTVSSSNNVLMIERIGDEPWGLVRQNYKRKALKGLLGKSLKFSVDVAGEFTDEYGAPIVPVNISVLVEGFPKGAMRRLGSQTLLSKKVTIATDPDPLDWQRYSIRFDMPVEEGVDVTSVEVSFMMTLGGVMKVRGPSLLEIK